MAAQCVFDPTVTGDLLVCPESATMLGTQPADACQWYRRDFPSGAAQLIPGATGPTLAVSYAQTPVYISVAATQASCTGQSPEVLVDGRTFLPLAVQSAGTFETGQNGEQLLCMGDTIWQIALPPYALNFQWYEGQNPVPGANSDTLVVTQPGQYWLTASPADCPNYTASLGLQIAVEWSTAPGCTLRSGEPAASFEAVVMPNPAQESFLIGVDISGTLRLTLVNALGQAIRQQEFAVSTELYTGDLTAGLYSLLLESKEGRVVKQVVIQ